MSFLDPFFTSLDHATTTQAKEKQDPPLDPFLEGVHSLEALIWASTVSSISISSDLSTTAYPSPILWETNHILGAGAIDLSSSSTTPFSFSFTDDVYPTPVDTVHTSFNDAMMPLSSSSSPPSSASFAFEDVPLFADLLLLQQEEEGQEQQRQQQQCLEDDDGLSSLVPIVSGNGVDEDAMSTMPLFDMLYYSSSLQNKVQEEEEQQEQDASIITVDPLTLTSTATKNNHDNKNKNKNGDDQTRNNRYACPIPSCPRTFTRHFNLRTHIETHNPDRDRPFPCSSCNKRFLRAHDLERHETVHSKLKAHACPGCDRRFAREDAVRRHLKSSSKCSA
ncbi:hypothetical protein HKX48_002522, partial [Thoreauomyces humboldtii]